jgi:hypothetical protein
MLSNFHEDYDESNESASMLTTNAHTISKRLVYIYIYVEENNALINKSIYLQIKDMI